MKSNTIRPSNRYVKEFIDLFSPLCRTRSSWQVWTDIISIAACAISNSVDYTPEIYAAREAEYAKCLARIGDENIPAKMFSIVTKALEEFPEQDFLGNIFMHLDLGNHWKGQFFTPTSVCQAIAILTLGDAEREIREYGWMSVVDPACGAGATLMAKADFLRKNGINYQEKALFVGQDIDRVAGMMAYIQLSILGCPGYIVVADTISNPMHGVSLLLPTKDKNQEFWFTPFFFTDTWIMRRKCSKMDHFISSIRNEQFESEI